MFTCPNCRSALTRKPVTIGVSWACDRCGGQAVGISLLRKIIDDKIVSEAWSCTITAPQPGRRPCPICSRNMIGVKVTVADHPVPLDLCRICEFIWFERGQYELMPPPKPKAKALGEIDETLLPQPAREMLAMQRIDAMRAEAARQPNADWKTLPAILGLPVEMDVPDRKFTPWATYLASLIIVAVSVSAFFDLDPIVNTYGLIPDQAGRYYGLTFLTSFFLHGGIIHLVGNIYFLLIFGASVEGFLGWRRWLLLLAIADFSGNILHIMSDENSSLPCIGASGGISGLLAFYAFKFPRARLGFLWFFGFVYGRWIRIPAWVAFALWILFQIWGSYQQMAGYSNVSSIAHLGGVAVGVFCWWLWRDLDTNPAPGLLQVRRIS